MVRILASPPPERRRRHKVGHLYETYTDTVRLPPLLLPSADSIIVGGHQVRAKLGKKQVKNDRHEAYNNMKMGTRSLFFFFSKMLLSRNSRNTLLVPPLWEKNGGKNVGSFV